MQAGEVIHPQEVPTPAGALYVRRRVSVHCFFLSASEPFPWTNLLTFRGSVLSLQEQSGWTLLLLARKWIRSQTEFASIRTGRPAKVHQLGLSVDIFHSISVLATVRKTSWMPFSSLYIWTSRSTAPCIVHILNEVALIWENLSFCGAVGYTLPITWEVTAQIMTRLLLHNPPHTVTGIICI